MAIAHATRQINAHPQQVWDALADFERATERLQSVSRMEILSDGPVGKGTRFRETRIIFGKEATEELEVTEWEPGRMYTVECDSHGAHFKTVIACRAEGDGTLVEMTMETTPHAFLAKVMNTLMGGMMAKQCSKAFAKDLDDIKRSVEGEQAQTEPA